MLCTARYTCVLCSLELYTSAQSEILYCDISSDSAPPPFPVPRSPFPVLRPPSVVGQLSHGQRQINRRTLTFAIHD